MRAISIFSSNSEETKSTYFLKKVELDHLKWKESWMSLQLACKDSHAMPFYAMPFYPIVPCQSPPAWLSSPSRSCWAAECRHRKAPPAADPGWRRWGGSRILSLRLITEEGMEKVEGGRQKQHNARLLVLKLVWPEVTDKAMAPTGWSSTYGALRYEGFHTGWVWAGCCFWQMDTRVCLPYCCSPGQTGRGKQNNNILL